MRAVRTVAAGLAGLILASALLAWLVPPMLDWGRYRSAIAAIAAARLGRPVAIGGAVTLRLLPHAVLTAADVTLPDQGDGLSARVATLRLQVALGALLRGRITATDLVLGAPVVRLPWPLPAAITDPLRPPAPRGFGARVEGGSLRVGRMALDGINASLVGDAAAGSLRASGDANAEGLPWRFRAVLGAPGQSGASPIDIAVAGQDQLRDTGGRFEGLLSSAKLAGGIDLGGGDLSRLLAGLLPGTGFPWRVRGAMTATRDRIEAPSLALESGDIRAQGNAVLSLAPPRLVVAVQTPSFMPALWIPLAARGASLGIPFGIDLSAGQVAVLDGQLTTLSLHIAGDGSTVWLERARAVLPGGATATMSGPIGSDVSGAPEISGPGTLDAPDPRATLRWLRPLAPALADAVPDAAIAHVVLQGLWHLAADGFDVKRLRLSLGDHHVEGNIAVRRSGRPGVTADLLFDRLALDAVLPIPPGLPARVADLGFDADMRLRAPSSTLWGMTLEDVSLDAKAGPGGVQVREATAMFAGAHMRASGSLSADGALTDGRFAADIQDLTRLGAEVPAGRAGWAPPWRDSATVELSASGPRDALALQFRAVSGDARLEAESVLDATREVASATVTLRHPGAPRLLAELGLPGSEAWLDRGSAALLCHLRITPFHVIAQDFHLNAAALRATGDADIDLSGSLPRMAVRVRAETLPLPSWAAWRALPALPGWAKLVAGRLRIEAVQVLAGLRPVASKVSADIAMEQGIVLAEPISATLAGGALSASFAADLSQSPKRMAARGDLAGATLQGPLTGLPIDPLDATFDLTASLDITGVETASVTGEARATITAASIGGVDFPRLGQSLVLSPPLREAAVRAAITQGASTGFSGTIETALEGNKLMFRRGLLTAPSGTLGVSGSVDLTAETADLRLVATPALLSPPSITTDFTGSWTSARRTDSLGEALSWGQHTKTRKPPAARNRGKPRHG